MMSEADRLPHALATVDVWPPDDTEESVVGTDLHQMTIINLRWGMNEIAGALTSPGQPAPWQALSHTVILGFQRPDGSRYKTLPDVFVYRQAISRRRGSVSINIDGARVIPLAQRKCKLISNGRICVINSHSNSGGNCCVV